MIRYVWFFLSVVLFFACGQREFNTDFAAHKKQVYQQAMQNGDAEVATQALYDILATSPDEVRWTDSLALLYVQQRAYNQAIKVSQQKLNSYPQDTLMLKIQALSYKALDNNKAALQAYEKLYSLTQNIYHLYEISTIQYSMTRLQECLQTAQNLHQHPRLEEAKVNLTFDKRKQVVPLKAAIFNIQGVVAKDMNKIPEATSFFEQALSVFSDFELAKGNLADLSLRK